VDLASGKKIWSVDTARQFGVAKGFFGAAGSPLVEDGRVIANIGGQHAGIVAFDAKTRKGALDGHRGCRELLVRPGRYGFSARDVQLANRALWQLVVREDAVREVGARRVDGQVVDRSARHGAAR